MATKVATAAAAVAAMVAKVAAGRGFNSRGLGSGQPVTMAGRLGNGPRHIARTQHQTGPGPVVRPIGQLGREEQQPAMATKFHPWAETSSGLHGLAASPPESDEYRGSDAYTWIKFSGCKLVHEHRGHFSYDVRARISRRGYL